MNLFYRGALAALTLTLFLSGCSAPTFNGSRTGNDSQFLMEYTVLNTTDGQTLSLEAGDALDVAVVSASGAVSVNIQRPANKSQVEISDLWERQKGNTKSSR